MLKSCISAVSIGLLSLSLTGCETSGVTIAPTVSSYAALPDVAVVPVPTAKPTNDLAMAGLAADIEAQDISQPTTIAYSTDANGSLAANSLVETALTPDTAAKMNKKAIPEEAISVATAHAVSAPAVADANGARECLMRAMYFESNRSSMDGQLAVGSVVMNRIASGRYPRTVCGVVSQYQQFAPGVMTRRLTGDTTDLARLAVAILGGKRHPKIVPQVMFFHTAGLHFPYNNMHYVVVAGGNQFYEKRSRRHRG